MGTATQQIAQADVQTATAEPDSVRSHALQRTGGFAGYSGNQATLRRLSRTAPRLQAKLAVGAVDDPLEAEADRVADQVMRSPDPALLSAANPAALQRKCAECEKEDDEEKVQRKEVQPPAADTITGSVANVIQRQEADPQAAATGNQQASPTTNTQAGSTNSQSASQAGAQAGANAPPPWSADIIDAGVQQIDSPQCFAEASGYSGSPFSGPIVKALFSANCSAPCAKAPLRLRIQFHTDATRIPRPGVKVGDKVSAVSAIAKFTPSGGGAESVLVQGQGDGIYVAPGYPLGAPFRTLLDFFTPPSAGTLTVSLINSDVFGSQALAIYSDEIPVQDCPNAQSGIPVPSTSIQTGRWLEVPDPVNAPLKYNVVDKNTPVDGPGILAEVEKDENGYFYRYNGQKIYLPENPFSPQPTAGGPVSQPSQTETPQ